MYFETLQSISLNGSPDHPNDDRCGAAGALAWVVDGATDLGPPGLLGAQGGAAWLAGAADRAFAGVSQSGIRVGCRAVFDQLETRFHAQKRRDPVAAWEVPKAAFGAAMLGDGALQVAWAADCPILWMRGDDVRWCTGDPDTSAEVADARALGAGVGAAPALTGAVLEDRRQSRGKAGHKALSPFADASAAITNYAEWPIAPGDELLLMSDGFASLVTDYGAYTALGLAQAVRAKGLAALVQEVREIEHADAACLQYPRFKVSDDTTALWLRVGPCEL